MSSGDIIRPVDIDRDPDGQPILKPGDEARILEGIDPETLAELKIRRMGTVIFKGNTSTTFTEGLIHVKTPRDEHYAAGVAEAGPDGIPHYPL